MFLFLFKLQKVGFLELFSALGNAAGRNQGGMMCTARCTSRSWWSSGLGNHLVDYHLLSARCTSRSWWSLLYLFLDLSVPKGWGWTWTLQSTNQLSTQLIVSPQNLFAFSGNSSRLSDFPTTPKAKGSTVIFGERKKNGGERIEWKYDCQCKQNLRLYHYIDKQNPWLTVRSMNRGNWTLMTVIIK